MDRIAAVFRNLKLKEGEVTGSPFQPPSLLNSMVTDQLWPLISATLDKYSTAGDSKTIERSCRCLRFLIRCLRPCWLLQDMATLMVTLYQRYPKHSSYLYLASILVDEFAGPDDVTGLTDQQKADICGGLIRMLNAFCMTTFQLLSSPTTQLRNHPDTIDDFFRLCTRFLQKRGENFLKESMLDSILNLTIASIQIDHRDANNSCTKFLGELIEAALPGAKSSLEAKAMVNTILNQGMGQKLVDTLIDCALFKLPSYFVPDMADILWKLVTWDRNAVGVWLASTLKSINTESGSGVVAATPEQLQEFYDNVSRAQNPKSVVQGLRYLSRLYR
jgi:transportin-3